VSISSGPDTVFTMKDQTDTICALSTPTGRSGLAVVRMSGEQSPEYFRKIFISKKKYDVFPVRLAMLGRIVDPKDSSVIDEAVATCFAAPNSYTGEDMVEISLHGNPVLIAALLDMLCSFGARIAEPGEFTMRAFLHGRIDLTQAEAVQDLIESTTMRQAQTAARQQGGSISLQLKAAKERLMEIIANLESTVEFVEEDLDLESREAVAEHLADLQEKLGKWIESYRQGKIIRDGFSMAVVGRPNVGKSSVFNALLAQDRSIVTEAPGTTRDLVSEFANMSGIPVRLTDTAGIRKSDDCIEQLGMDRSRQAIADSDAVLLVVDTSRPQSSEDADLRGSMELKTCIVAMNKSDLVARWTFEEMQQFAGKLPLLVVSAKTGTGIEQLHSTIINGIMGTAASGQDGIMVTHLRHCRCLENVRENLERAAAALGNGMSEEFVLTDLHSALKALGEITGETHVEDVLEQIFSSFCIGK
jgi:tRNA modification GTPase